MATTLVKNLEKMSRPIIFDGLKSKTCHPSDIDSMMEFYNKYLILTEVKEDNKDITTGQSICLTRIADSWNKSGKDKVEIVILTHHNPADNQIMLVDSTISKVYVNGQWKNHTENYKDFLMKFGCKFNIKHL